MERITSPVTTAPIAQAKSRPTSKKDIYSTALKWLYDSIKAVKVGTTTREIASKWPSAKEAWGYAEKIRLQPIFGGTALALRSTTNRSSRASGLLDHPIEIKEAWCSRSKRSTAKIRVGREDRGDADRAQGQDRNHFQFPGRADHVVDPIPGYLHSRRPLTPIQRMRNAR